MDGKEFVVLDSISLHVDEGEFAAIVGPSGCGKSTLLNIIAGIETHDPDEGGSVEVFPRAGHSTLRVGYVFQNARLLNWLTVEGNIQFALEAQEIPKERWRELITKYLEMVGLEGQEKNFPLNLSGGMQQRVAIARALASEPQLLLFDEATSSLDSQSERRVQNAIDNLVNTRTTIVVAHRLSTITRADHIYVLDKGRIVEDGNHHGFALSSWHFIQDV